MTTLKGPNLEELVRAYFAHQGYFSVRSASYCFGGSEVTDIDVWLYGRQGGGSRTRAIVDVKNKRSPKAFERIVWARGMQEVMGVDQAIVATTDSDPNVARFARQSRVTLLTKAFLVRLEKGIVDADRFSLEEFEAHVRAYPAAKMDGDWLRILQSVRSSLVSETGFGSFNQASVAFRFFARKVATRAQHSEQALRCALLVASYASIALDSALAALAYDSSEERQRAIVAGVRFGDDGGGRVQAAMRDMLEIISSRMENGKALAAKANATLDNAFGSIRAEIISEFFGREMQAISLFKVARELERRAFGRTLNLALTIDEKQLLGVMCDFVDVPRTIVSAARFIERYGNLAATVENIGGRGLEAKRIVKPSSSTAVPDQESFKEGYLAESEKNEGEGEGEDGDGAQVPLL